MPADIRELFGIELPVIQAPMAGSQGSKLAIAVSVAGGLGSQPCAMLGPQQIRSELAAITATTSKPYNVNFFVHKEPRPDAAREAEWRRMLAPYFAEHGIEPSMIEAGPQRLPFNDAAADVLEAFKPPVVSFHFGLPSDALMRRVKAWGAKIVSSATTVDEARYLEAKGVDAVIAQGSEAGGHRGMFLTDDLSSQLPLSLLVPQVVAAVKVPVIAAGGVASARDVEAAMALGASGVQAGTAYLSCPEATTNPLHRAALKTDAAAVTAITNLFTGRPARGIVNRLMRELGPLNPAAPEFPLAATAIVALRSKAEPKGLDHFTSMWAGQNARSGREMPGAELTRQLAGGAVSARRWT
ncbi:MAG TPA: nitronate monooxygenase [Vicinamibacterales bacterium]|nr:nitronate monooxygenase [Vicinamibacterales bacterium]